MMIHKVTPSVDTQLNEPTHQISIKVSKFVKLTKKEIKSNYKNFGGWCNK